MNIHIINGPNLSILGKREPNIYGNQSFEDYFIGLKKKYSQLNPSIVLSYFQSNHEGEIIDYIHKIGFESDGVIANMGALSHTSIAIADAIKAVSTPFIEVHISNIHQRESFRHRTVLTASCKGMICGLGLDGYRLGIEYFLS